MTKETLQIVKRQVRGEGKRDKSRVRILNIGFQQLSHKENYHNSQCKEIEDNAKKGKSSALYQKKYGKKPKGLHTRNV